MNMPSCLDLFKQGKLKAVIAPRPFLSLVQLGADILQTGNDAQILDMQFSKNPFKDIKSKIEEYQPNFVGMTFTTPLFKEAKQISEFIKNKFPKITILAGGPHPSIFPIDTLRETKIDISVYGEGDITIQEIVQNKPLENVLGIAYKKSDSKIIKNYSRQLINNLDNLPFPAWHLIPVSQYINPKVMAKKNPVGTIETSRGCIFGCTFCNKKIFGHVFRIKSVKRVVDEFELLKKSGFNEVHVFDDMFSTYLQRAKDICDEIIRRKLNITWQLDCGVRVNSIDQEFFDKCKKAGCYKVAFGFESGNQKILDRINKGIKVEDGYKVVEMAKKSGLETIGFFILGLPDETIETMEQTIKFACSLGLDYAKATILVPFPGTPIFDEWKEKGIIKSENWEYYNDHNPQEIYTHPNLDWETLHKYYNKFYKRFYFRPSYIWHRFWKTLLNEGIKGIWGDFMIAIKTFVT